MYWDKTSIEELDEILRLTGLNGAVRHINLYNITKSDHKEEMIFPYHLSDPVHFRLREQNITYRYNEEETLKIDSYRNDIIGFINDHFGGRKLLPYQLNILNDFIKNDINYYGLSNELGITTLFCYMMYHQVFYHPNKNLVYISIHKDDISHNIESFIENYTHIPFYLKVGIKTVTDYSIQFENGCVIYFKMHKERWDTKRYHLVVADSLLNNQSAIYSQLIQRSMRAIDNATILSFGLTEVPKDIEAKLYDYTYNPNLSIYHPSNKYYYELFTKDELKKKYGIDYNKELRELYIKEYDIQYKANNNTEI